jgi:hypothetical protein
MLLLLICMRRKMEEIPCWTALAKKHPSSLPLAQCSIIVLNIQLSGEFIALPTVLINFYLELQILNLVCDHKMVLDG